MIRSLFNVLYGSTPAEFKSAFGVDESVVRLKAATKRSALFVFSEQAAAGAVSASRVRLQRLIPMVGNSFKPFFVGRFEARASGVYLTGAFTMHWFTKVFLSVWFGFLLFIGIFVALSAPASGDGVWVGLLAESGMFGLGIALVLVGKWFARNDAAWLSNVIRAALEDPAEVSPSLPRAGTVATAATRPAVVRIAAFAMVFVGVMTLVGAISDVSAWRNGEVIARFSSESARVGQGLLGVGLLGLALGIFLRKRWAWQLVLLLIAVSGVTSIPEMFVTDIPGGIVVRVIFGVLCVLVALYWGRWWYAQRVHFTGDTRSS